MDKTSSIYIDKIKDWIIHLLNFFPNFIHGFGLVWKEKLFEGDMIRDRGEVFTK